MPPLEACPRPPSSVRTFLPSLSLAHQKPYLMVSHPLHPRLIHRLATRLHGFPGTEPPNLHVPQGRDLVLAALLSVSDNGVTEFIRGAGREPTPASSTSCWPSPEPSIFLIPWTHLLSSFLHGKAKSSQSWEVGEQAEE